MSISPILFRQALAQYASGVTVVTTYQADQLHGVTVSAFSSVSAEPPLVLICLSNHIHSLQAVQSTGYFAVNILSAAQQTLGLRFAGLLPEFASNRFLNQAWTAAPSGSPLLPDTLAWLDCRVWQVVPAGDHTIVIGLVTAADVTPAAPGLIYQNRQWQRPSPLT
jgi:flavin reductase (DIM6/NTAB) family NADH-FMN oxidoreductase RutF